MASFKGICGGAYSLNDRALAYQECINFYPESHQGTKTLQPTGGYEDLVDFDNGGFIRALYRTTKSIGESVQTNTGSVIVVCGGDVIWYKTDGTWQVLGEISSVLNQIDIVDDGVGICIVDGEQMYRINMITLDFEVVDFTETKPTKLAVLDFITICIGTNADGSEVSSNRFYYSNIADNSTWDPLNYFEMAGRRDPIINMTTDSTRLYLFSANVYQIWQTNSRSITKPFIKQALGLDDVGLYGKDSLCSLAGTQYFLGSVSQGSPSLYKANGASIEKISTTAIDKELTSTAVTDCTSYAFTERGHSFILFNFDTLDRTFVYDELTKEWHTRAYRGNDGILHRWQPQYIVNINGRLILGSTNESKLYEYSNDIYTQADSGEILRIRTSPNLKDEFRSILTNRITMDVMVGRGIPDTLLPSTLMFRYAYDGGYSGWSSREDVSLGKRGNYLIKPEFGSLGVGQSLVIEISISDNCNCAIHDVYLYNRISNARG